MVTATLSPLAGSRCVVTGGLGFIGSNLAVGLAEAGASVTVIDSLVPRHGGNRRNLAGSGVEVVIADVGDAAVVAPVVSGADVVFNLAGQVSHVDSMTDPLGDLELNVRSQLAFLETLRTAGTSARVVYASTRQVYGRPQYLPVDEQHPVRPVDVNGVCKYAAEQLHLVYHEAHDLATCALRLTNVYGPRQRLAGDHLGFLPVFIRRALDGEAITLFGDGTQQRDCIYVDDVVTALGAAALSSDAVGEILNLGGEAAQIVDIAHAIVAAAGSGSVVTTPWPEDRKRIDIGSYRGDYAKAKAMLDWRPVTSLTEGLKTTIDFYREHREQYR